MTRLSDKNMAELVECRLRMESEEKVKKVKGKKVKGDNAKKSK